MPTQGSWRPLVTMSAASPALLIVGTGVRIELVGLSADHWSRAEAGNWPEKKIRALIKAMEALHVGIDVPAGLEPTPANIRELRLRAGMTKLEAASCVGLSTTISFHNYETGRHSFPMERWQAFLDALRDGSFREHLTGAYRKGALPRPDVVPGEKERPRLVDMRDHGGAAACEAAHRALRLPAAEIGAVLGMRKHEIYALEKGLKRIPPEVLNILKSMLVSRIDELKAMAFTIADAADLAREIEQVRATQAEAGANAYRNSLRPSANISLLLQRQTPFAPGLARSLAASMRAARDQQVRDCHTAIKIIESTLSITG